ncbi:thialysine N-epsilon-acetyltransferase-like isoform X2 [Accipiter gentilis]|uniref:thialysine N-epsilon-acetyltransferase-like isoform X2 n=1 Tax=Astur gentilis TaxID=8957 RepID=UPI002110728B|nr:thialysine N-epsilon-acetyltransferase-like isoform X2 [Accipiter gentilis]
MAWGVRACTPRHCARLRDLVREWVTLEPGPEPERELPSEEGEALGGFAVASWGFSTWRGPDLRLGELWVPPPLRGQGIEELLLRKVAQVAVAGGGSQLRVEAPGPWTPPLPPPPGVTDLARAEGWRPVTFGGAAMARLGGTHPPGGAP